MKVLPHNGIGYINNRGYSKYWGVSACPATGNWRLQVRTKDHDNLTLLFKNTVVTEEEAARIASFFYENRDADLTGPVYEVETTEGLYAVMMASRTVRLIETYDESYFEELIAQDEEDNGPLDSTDLVDMMNIDVQDDFSIKFGNLNSITNDPDTYATATVFDSPEESFSEEEKETIQGIVTMYANNQLSSKAAAFIGHITQIMD